MRVIGLTGGIGTGKSTVAAYLREKGIPVVDADAISRQLTACGSPFLSDIRALLGDGAFYPDGSLDRQAVASLIFSDARRREAYEAIITAETVNRCRQAVDALRPVGHRLAVVDAPLLFEAGFDRYVDEIWVVDAPLAVRLARVQARDGLSREAVMARIGNQMPAEEKVRRATHVLQNDGDRITLYRAVDRLLEGYVDEE